MWRKPYLIPSLIRSLIPSLIPCLIPYLIICVILTNPVSPASLASEEKVFKSPLVRDKDGFFQLDPAVYQNSQTDMNNVEIYDESILDQIKEESEVELIRFSNPTSYQLGNAQCHVEVQLHPHCKNRREECSPVRNGHAFTQYCSDDPRTNFLYHEAYSNMGSKPLEKTSLAYHLFTAVDTERKAKDTRNIQNWLNSGTNARDFPAMKTRKDFEIIDEIYQKNKKEMENWRKRLSGKGCDNMSKEDVDASIECQSINNQKPKTNKNLKLRPNNFPPEPKISDFPVKFSIPFVCRIYNVTNNEQVMALNATVCTDHHTGLSSHCTCTELLKSWSLKEKDSMFIAVLANHWQIYLGLLFAAFVLFGVVYCTRQCQKANQTTRYHNQHRSIQHCNRYDGAACKLLPKTETMTALGYSRKHGGGNLSKFKKLNLSIFDNENASNSGLLSNTNRIYAGSNPEIPISYPPEQTILKKSINHQYYIDLRKQDVEQYERYPTSKQMKINSKPYQFDKHRKNEWIHTPDRLEEFFTRKYLHETTMNQRITVIDYEWNKLSSGGGSFLGELRRCDKEFRNTLSKQELLDRERRDRYEDIFATFNQVNLKTPMKLCSGPDPVYLTDTVESLRQKLLQIKLENRGSPYANYNLESRSSYINASWVPSFLSSDAYICTQGPKLETTSHFWQMVYEQNSSVIVMLTKLQEGSSSPDQFLTKTSIKCNKYWPPMETDYQKNNGFLDDDKIDQNRAIYDNMLVEIVSEENYANYKKRVFIVHDLNSDDTSSEQSETSSKTGKTSETGKTKENLKNSGKRVVQYHFLDWQDQCGSAAVVGLLDFHMKVKMEKRVFEEKCGVVGPMVIHCSAGVGRTGSFALLDSCLEQLEKQNRVNVCNMLAHLRYHRTNIVQTSEQYNFIYKILATAVTARKHGLVDFIKVGESFDSFEHTMSLTENEKFEENNNNNNNDDDDNAVVQNLVGIQKLGDIQKFEEFQRLGDVIKKVSSSRVSTTSSGPISTTSSEKTLLTKTDGKIKSSSPKNTPENPSLTTQSSKIPNSIAIPSSTFPSSTISNSTHQTTTQTTAQSSTITSPTPPTSKNNKSSREALKKWAKSLQESLNENFDLEQFEEVQRPEPEFAMVKGVSSNQEFHLSRWKSKGTTHSQDLTAIRESENNYSQLWDYCWENGVSLVVCFKNGKKKVKNNNSKDKTIAAGSTSNHIFPSLDSRFDETGPWRTKKLGLAVTVESVQKSRKSSKINKKVTRQNSRSPKSESIKSEENKALLAASLDPSTQIPQMNQNSAFRPPYRPTKIITPDQRPMCPSKELATTPTSQNSSTDSFFPETKKCYELAKFLVTNEEGNINTSKRVVYWEVDTSKLSQNCLDSLLTEILECYMGDRSKIRQANGGNTDPETVQNNKTVQNSETVRKSTVQSPFIGYILPALYTDEPRHFKTTTCTSTSSSHRVSPKTVSTTTSLMNERMFIVNEHKSAIIGSKGSQRSSMSSQTGSMKIQPDYPAPTAKPKSYNPPVLFIDESYENLENTNFQDKFNEKASTHNNSHKKNYQDSKFSETRGLLSLQTPCNKNQWGLQISAMIAITQLLSDFEFMERLLHYHNGDREVVMKYAVFVILRKFSEQPLGGNTPNYTSIKWICTKVSQYLERCNQ